MKILGVDLKNGVVEVQVETLDDLWVLYNVIRENDVVYAKTTREVKVGEGSEGSRLPMTLGVLVKKVEFQEFSSKMRIMGIVVNGPEKYGVRGKHHTLTIGVGDSLRIEKKELSSLDLELLKRQVRGERLLLVSIDYDEVCVALVAEQGVRYLWESSLGLPSKHYSVDTESLVKGYLKQVVDYTLSALKSEDVSAVVVVGPGDFKNQLKTLLSEHTSKPIYMDTTSTGGCKGVSEALNRDVVRNIVSELSLVKAAGVLEEFKELLVKEPGLVTYGLREVREAALIGAIQKLLVLDELLRTPVDEDRALVYEALRHAYERKAEVVIVPSKSDVGVELAGFGGIVAILRFKVYSNPP
jgi:protein pelota